MSYFNHLVLNVRAAMWSIGHAIGHLVHGLVPRMVLAPIEK